MPKLVTKTSSGAKVLADAAYFLKDGQKPKRLLQLWIQEWCHLRNSTVGPFWNLFRNAAESDAFGETWNMQSLDTLEGSTVKPARVRDGLRGFLAGSYSRQPKFELVAMRDRMTEPAKHLTKVLNGDWKLARREHREMRYGFQSAYLCGIGPFCTTFDTDYTAAANSRQRRLKLAERMRKDAALSASHDTVVDQLEAAAPDLRTTPVKPTYNQDDRIMSDRITTFHVLPEMFFADPYCTGTWDARFMGRFVFTSQKAVENDPNLRGKVTEAALKASRIFGTEIYQDLFTAGGRDLLKWYAPGSAGEDLVCLIEAFVREDDGTFTKLLCPWMGDEQDDLLHADAVFDLGLPYTITRWSDQGNRLLCAPDPLHYWPHVLEERDIRSIYHDAMTRSNLDAYAVDGEAISEAELRKFTYVPKVGVVARLRSLNGRDIRQVITNLPKSNLSGDFAAYMAILERNFATATGRGPNQNLQAMKSGTSSGEAQLVGQTSKQLEDLMTAGVEDAFSDVGKKRVQLIAQFFDGDRIGAYGGLEARKWWEKNPPNPSDIEEGLGVVVERGSTAPVDADAYQFELRSLMQDFLVRPDIMAHALNPIGLEQERLRLMGVADNSPIRAQETGNNYAAMLAQALQPQGAQGSAPRPTQASNGRR